MAKKGATNKHPQSTMGSPVPPKTPGQIKGSTTRVVTHPKGA